MKLYNVTLVKFGSMEIYADSAEEAINMVNESDDKQIFWGDFSVTDADEIDKES